MKKILVFTSTVLLSAITVAQNHVPCGTDEMHQKLFHEHPEYSAGIIRANQKLDQFTHNFMQQPQLKSGDPYIIPVVFHVIHNYGPENIGDAQIHDALKQVNIQFRKLNADTVNIMPTFKARAADCKVEFRLAQLDPDGNCTSGITRTVSPLTAIGDHQVKSLIQWPPDKYLNVYICNQAAGLAGHSMMPAAADTVPQWDGIVMQHSYVGTIGTSAYALRTVLTHEIGHYLNLQHIWGGNNVPDYYYLPVGNAGNCAFDDDVSDTPNTIGWQSCNLNGQSCGELSNVQNYMDYSYCSLMFTEGQKLRMHAALNSPVAHRNNLWQPANLIATGTDDVNFHLCGAKFMSDKTVICAGESVNFSDISYHGVTERLWAFPGGTTTTNTDSLATVIYANPGKYDVTLKSGNGDEMVEVTLEDYITVLNAPGEDTGIDQAFEYDQHYYNRWITVDKGTPYNWEFTDLGFASGHSFKLDNFSAPINTSFEFYSHPVDVSDLTSLAISFDWAYGRIEGTDSDGLQVSVSNNCGESWYVVRSYYGSSSLKTVSGFVTGPFVPADDTQWKNALINSIPAAYLTDKLMVKFKFENRGNNNFYIDNIQLGHPNQLKVPAITHNDLEIYPNPANETLHLLAGENHSITQVSVYSVTGQLVKTYTGMEQLPAIELDVKDLMNGYYLFRVESQYGEVVVPQVIKH